MFDVRFRARAARKTDAGGQADVILVDPERGDQPGIDSLFRRFAVEVFIVGLRVGASMVDDAVPMIRRCIERIKLQWNIAGIDDVVIGAGRDDDREARSDRRPNAVENRLTAPLLHAKELVELVDFRPDLFLGL